MKFSFSNIHRDGVLRSRWDFLLRIVGDFSVLLENRIAYQESEFCVVEFAIQLGKWLQTATEIGPDFIYNSLESDVEGLIRFHYVVGIGWRFASPHQAFNSEKVLEFAEVRNSAISYIRELRANLAVELDIFDLFEDPDERRFIQTLI